MIYMLIHIGSFLLPWGGVIYVFTEGIKDHLWQGIALILIGLLRGFINSSMKGAFMMAKEGDMKIEQLDNWNTIDRLGKTFICIVAIILILLV